MKPDSFDAHRVLEIKPDADEDTIRRAFRRLAKKHHPDQQGGDARQFNLICRAYRQLTGIMPQDIFPPPNPGASGRHHLDDLTLDLEQVAHGGETMYRYLRQTPCGYCRIQPRDDCQICLGSGVVYQMRDGRFIPDHCPRCLSGRPQYPCPECKGAGLIPMRSDVRLDLPPGLEDGQYLRIPGQGHYPPPPRSLPGDLYLRIRLRSHSLFVPRDRDLHLWWDRPPWPTNQPDLVPTLYGPVRLSHIPKPGRVIRVPGKGLPKLGGSDRGRLYVHY
jgi:molecular chaperone DnaJ